MLILLARVILAISIFSRALTGRDWFSQGQEEDEAAVRVAPRADAEPAEAETEPAEGEAAEAEAAEASPAGSKTARNAAAAIPGRRRVREPRISVIAQPPLPAASRGRSHPGRSLRPRRSVQS